MTTDTKLVAPADLFHDYRQDKHECCSCCRGYCPEVDTEPKPYDLYRLTVDGTEYLSDRYVAVRADHLSENTGKGVTVITSTKDQTGPEWVIPDTRPGPSTEWFTPSVIRGALTAGWTIHQGTGDAPANPQHIYDGDQHVGFVMPVIGDRDSLQAKAARLSEMPCIRALADECESRGWPIDGLCGDTWDLASQLLHVAQRIT